MTTGGATKGQLLFQIRVVLDDSQSCQEWMVSDSCTTHNKYYNI